MSLVRIRRQGLRSGSPQQSIADPAAFEAFYRAHAEAVLVFLARRVRDPQIALDLTAETFARAFSQRGRLRATSEAQATAWIFQIARREHLQYVRRGAVERRAIERLGIETGRLTDTEARWVEDQIAGSDAWLAEVLAGLPGDQREAVGLRVVDDLDYPEVARRLGISEPAARARVSRGLRALRKTMGDDARGLAWLTD